MNWIIFAMSSGGKDGGSPAAMLLPILGMVVIFYLLLIRPQQKRQKDTQRMLESIRKGDKVMTSGGIYGTIAGVKDNAFILKIADNVKIEVAKSAVASLVSKGE